jgi:hypothetical protein
VFAYVPALVLAVPKDPEQARPPLSPRSVRRGVLAGSCGFLPITWFIPWLCPELVPGLRSLTLGRGGGS